MSQARLGGETNGETCVLAYSGGLDTSVAVAWLRETFGFEVVTCTGDLGSVRDLAAIQKKAIASGARKAIVQDARDVFVATSTERHARSLLTRLTSFGITRKER